MEKYKRNTILFFIGLIVILLILRFTVAAKFDRRLADNHFVVCGTILEMRSGKGVNVIYTFLYKGEIIVKNVSSPKKTLEDYKKGKTKILIVFEKDNPRNCSILNTTDDYVNYKISLKDTINISCN